MIKEIRRNQGRLLVYTFDVIGLIAGYHEDQLGNLIRNVDVWIKDIFKDLLEK